MRERELHWLREQKDLFERYQGRWIAIEGDTFIAEGDSFESVYKATKEKNIEIPFIFLVPPKKEDAVFVGL